MSDIFNSCVFVISQNEDVEEIEKLVVRNGGSVRKTFRIAVSKRKKIKRLFHVVSWLQEDDGRLAAASRAEAELITPGFVRKCDAEGTLLDFTEYAEGDDTKALFEPRTKARLFLRPCPDDCRELEEQPQTLQEFASFLETDWIAPTKDQPRKLIYVLPVVSSGRKSNLTLTTLPMICGFLQAFLGLESIETLPEVALNQDGVKNVDTRPLLEMPVREGKGESKARGRSKSTGKSTSKKGRKRKRPRYEPLLSRRAQDGTLQLEVIDLIAAMKELLPEDGFALIIVTDEDLYESGREDDQLLGRAAGQDLVCVVSTHTLSTTEGKGKGGRALNPGSIAEWGDESRMQLLNLLNTAVHEVLHIFALDHCAMYLCTMAAGVSAPSTDSDLPYTSVCLCPCCVRKLQLAVGFGFGQRLKTLESWYRRHSFDKQAKWAAAAYEALLCR